MFVFPLLNCFNHTTLINILTGFKKRYTRIAASMYVSKNNAKQSIGLFIKEWAFMSKTHEKKLSTLN